MANTKPSEISAEEFTAALEHIRAGHPVRLRLSTVADLLKAVDLGIVDKSEARRLLGLRATRGSAAASQARNGGRFVRSQ